MAGVAFNVKLMPVKVIDGDWDDIFGSPNQGTDDIVARGIRYAADNGAKVINMSIGRTGPPSPVIEDAIKYAVGKGAFIAIAAGNDFGDGNPTEVLAEIASRVQGAVSVGAVDRSSNRAFYSSTGSWVELAAPGGVPGFGSDGLVFQQTVDLRFGLCLAEPQSCGVASSFAPPRFDVFGFFGFEGTSMAAPHVSGLAALLMQQGITSPAAVEAAMERFAKDLGTAGRTTNSASASFRRRTRCADSGSRVEIRSPCSLRIRVDARLGADAVPAVRAARRRTLRGVHDLRCDARFGRRAVVGRRRGRARAQAVLRRRHGVSCRGTASACSSTTARCSGWGFR
jgi:subtilisin family serine protease